MQKGILTAAICCFVGCIAIIACAAQKWDGRLLARSTAQAATIDLPTPRRDRVVDARYRVMPDGGNITTQDTDYGYAVTRRFGSGEVVLFGIDPSGTKVIDCLEFWMDPAKPNATRTMISEATKETTWLQEGQVTIAEMGQQSKATVRTLKTTMQVRRPESSESIRVQKRFDDLKKEVENQLNPQLSPASENLSQSTGLPRCSGFLVCKIVFIDLEPRRSLWRSRHRGGRRRLFCD